jgi:phosphohistidine swiveling domain-containing protein
MTPLAIPLDSPDLSLDRAGGKAANLSSLRRAGFPVPPGFVVPTAAYRAFVAAGGLDERIVALAGAARADDPASFERAASAIQALFAGAAVPADVAAAIEATYGRLGAPPVAVRSSATAEDRPEASFAGQQDTYLNVRGREALVGAVRRCWASLWTARAIAYRARRGIDPGAVALAVVVQELVPAEAAGVLFTVDPVDGDGSKIVVNAAWGLGEAVVGGRVTPDTVVIDKASGRVLRREVAEKEVLTAPTADGTAEVPVEPERRRQAVLDEAQAAELAALGRAVEAHFGCPQDLEWALAGGRIYLLQARPVTALPAPQLAAPADGMVDGDDDWPAEGTRASHPFDLWTQADVGERWPEPVTPLTWSTALDQVNLSMRHGFRDRRRAGLERIQWAARLHGRVYMNEGAMGHMMRAEYGLPAAMMGGALGSGVAPAADGDRIDWARLLRALPGMAGLVVDRLRNERVYRRRWREIDRWVADFQARDLAAADDRALWAELDRVWMPRLIDATNLHADASVEAMMAVPMMEKLCAAWLGRAELAHELLVGLDDVRQAEMAPALHAMAGQLRALGLADLVLDAVALRADPRARPFLAALDRFLVEHGHRCAVEAEWRHPRWVEAPAQVLDLIAGYLRAGDVVDPRAAEARQRRRRDEAVRSAEARLDPLRRAVLRAMLRRSADLFRLRDNGQHYLVKLLLPPRRIFAELGVRFAARGWLAADEDVFFLAYREIGAACQAGGAGADWRAVVGARRRAYRAWFAVRAPVVVGPDRRPLAEPVETAEGPAVGAQLVGIPASGGTARGVARVIATVAEAGRLSPGEILVTRATDPGWTPVFPLVGGLVLEVGGQLSHGAIVAREYGIPAVVNVGDATIRIRDGQTVVVDGAAGRVDLEPPPVQERPPTVGPAAVS